MMLLLRPLMRYADFKGRASRAEYWLFMTTQGLVYGLCVLMAVMSLTNKTLVEGLLGLVGWLALAGLVMVGLILPNYAVTARRLHDSGRSAKWMALLLPAFVGHFTGLMSLGSLVQSGTAGSLDGPALAQAAIGALAGAGIMAVVATVCGMVLGIMMLLPGTRGENRYGPDPQEPEAISPSGLATLDDDRWEALIAEAKGAAVASDALPRTAQTDWGRPAWDPGVAPSRPFGRRA